MTQEQKNNIIKWIEALRSGEFSQGRCYLKNIEREKVSYCCLGVACKINGIPENEDSFLWPTGKEDGLPNIIWFKRTFGFDPNRNFNWSQEINSSLYQLNDKKNKSFFEIADIIEKEFLL